MITLERGDLMDTRQLLRKEIETAPDALFGRIRFVKALKERNLLAFKSRAAGCFRVGSCQGLVGREEEDVAWKTCKW